MITQKIEEKSFFHKEYELKVRYFAKNSPEINLNLHYKVPHSQYNILVFTCRLDCLWGINHNHNYIIGDYYQGYMFRKRKKILPKVSFCAILHEIIRKNRGDLIFIKNIYSTSKDIRINNGNYLTSDSKRFWEKQVENNFAEWIESEKRFKAILK